MLEKMKNGLLSEEDLREMHNQIDDDVIEHSARFENSIASDELDIKPSTRIKRNLDQVFEAKFNPSVRRNSVISFPDFSQSPKKNWMAWSLKIAAIGLILISLKLSFNSQPSFQSNGALLADTLHEMPMDSNMLPSDSLSF